MRVTRAGQFFVKGVCVLLLIGIAFWVRVPVARAISDAERSFLSLYFTDEELRVVSATRSLQSVARIAENIEVVTAADIELMNAHTLADVLYRTNGMVVEFTSSFVSTGVMTVQGSKIFHVMLLRDGVPLNAVDNNTADAGLVPVTDIERIEIVKGPASSAWGSALGGVVNVITKGPGAEPFQGNASVSYGTKNSVDYRAAVSGRTGGLGYYVSGTGLRTDGLTDGFNGDSGYASAKLSYDLSARASLSFNFSYNDGPRGDGIDRSYDLSWDKHYREAISRLALRTAIGSTGEVNLSLWNVDRTDDYFMRTLSTEELQYQYTLDWSRTGAGVNYAVSTGPHRLVVGGDYLRGSTVSHALQVDADIDQWAVYANDTIAFGALAIIPGIRYDEVSTTGGFVSPSLGATYGLSRDLLLRATAARGFSLPTPGDTISGTNVINNFEGNPDLKPETVWSYQAGVEANVLDALWLKVSAFRHDLDDAFKEVAREGGPWTRENGGRERRQGVELGFKTVPYRHLTLAAGAMFMEGEDLETGEKLDEIPTQLYNISLKYDDGSFRALLLGNHRNEVYEPVEIYQSDLGGFIVDLHLAKKFALGPKSAVEVFFSVHNLFDGTQRWSVYYPSAGRWVEGGLRVAF